MTNSPVMIITLAYNRATIVAETESGMRQKG